jgi:hypothetical protein
MFLFPTDLHFKSQVEEEKSFNEKKGQLRGNIIGNGHSTRAAVFIIYYFYYFFN